MNIVRILYEKGVEVRRLSSSEWRFQAIIKRAPLSVTLQEIPNIYGIRPILVTERLNSGEERTYLLPLSDGKDVLEIQLSELEQRNLLEDVSTMYDRFNLSYILGALIYHCKRLAETYSVICSSFSNLPRPEDYQPDLSHFGFQPEPYYEFDALITAARRSYDTMRYLLWKIFGPGKGSLPSSFYRTLPLCTRLPETLAARLQESWSQYGEKLTDYRDCIQHYVPVDFGRTYAVMEPLPEGIWSTSILIPDNPEAKSKTKLHYKSRIDALTYGWKLTNELFDISWLIMNEIPKKE